jgi:NAD(P)-dependent dehydrogenase (short-subunit alcohol dehydrogenase family)
MRVKSRGCRVTLYAEFAARCPQLLPAHIATPEFIAKFEHDALRFLQHEEVVKRFLHSQNDFIAFNHFNAYIETALLKTWIERTAKEQGVNYEDRLLVTLMDMALKVVSTPEDVANLVLFLDSDTARTITGQSINVDAGNVMVG